MGEPTYVMGGPVELGVNVPLQLQRDIIASMESSHVVNADDYCNEAGMMRRDSLIVRGF
jgi:hypothetical protein